MYLYSIAHAVIRISIASTYFVPDSHVVRLLVEARARGVIVEVGIKSFEYQQTMIHCKYMIVDGI